MSLRSMLTPVPEKPICGTVFGNHSEAGCSRADRVRSGQQRAPFTTTPLIDGERLF